MTGRRLRARPRTLAGRLTLGVLCLTAAALAAFGAAAAVLLHHSLLDDVDDRLRALPPPIPAETSPGSPEAPESPEASGPDGGRPPLPTDLRWLSLDSDGTVLWSVGQTESDPGTPDTGGVDAEDLRRMAEAPSTLPDDAGGPDWRVAASAAPDGTYLVTAQSLSGLERTLDRLVLIEAVLGAVLLAALGAGAAAVVRVQLRPLRRIERTAGAIAAGDLAERVADDDPATETGRLGAALNTMLGELAASIRDRTEAAERMRRFVADASHELRTPLASIRGFAELYRQSRDAGKVRADPPVDGWMERVHAQASRMSSLVDDLLLLARFDSAPALDMVGLDLRDVAEEAVLDARARCPRTPVHMDAPDPVRVRADGDRVRQVLGNLLANALVHPPEGTPVRVRVRTAAGLPDAGPGGAPPDGGYAVVDVHDDGPGVPGAEVERIFDRFHRVERSRSRDSGGSGLGLAISTAVAEAHGGALRLTADGPGTTFSLYLPRGPSPRDPEPARE